MSGSINLESLRKQAKTILKEYRAGNASAIRRVQAQLSRIAAMDIQQASWRIKLADVQHVLAREHGYANWGELKRRDEPLARFLAAVRSGSLNAAQQELKNLPDLAQGSIHAACVIGDAGALQYYLEHDPLLLNAQHQGWTPLLYACATPFHRLSARHAAGILECAALLLDRGADPNTYTLSDPSDSDSKLSASFRASMAGNRSVALLLFQRGAIPAGMGATPMASKEAFWGIPSDAASLDKGLRELFEDPIAVDEMRKETRKRMTGDVVRGTEWLKPEQILSQSPRNFYEPAYPLNQAYNVMIWKLLVQRGVSPDWTDTRFDSPLHHLALWDGDAVTAEVFLTHGADPDLRGADGRTPYFLAVRAGNIAVADVLGAHGANAADVRPIDELVGACRRADAGAAWSIVQSNPSVVKTMGLQDREVLLQAAAKNRIAQVKLMVELGFDLSAFGQCGATALHVAAWHGHVEIAELLLHFLAPANMRDATYGTSPLGWAAHGSRNCRDADDHYGAVVDTLRAAGADYSSAVDRWGTRPESVCSPHVGALLRREYGL